MRHGKRRTRFGRQQGHRAATVKGIARSLIIHQRIKTTHTKAKEARRLFERLVTIAKKETLAARRQAFAILGDETLVFKLFREVSPLFKNRRGGYTRIIPYNFRKGDGASMVFLELTERKVEKKPVKKAKKEEKDVKPKAVAPKAKPKERKAEAKSPKAAPEVKPEIKEERVVEEVKRAKAKDEARKIEKQKGFIKKVKGFFRRRTHM